MPKRSASVEFWSILILATLARPLVHRRFRPAPARAFAGTAPFGPEIHDYRLGGFQDFRFEIGLIDFNCRFHIVSVPRLQCNRYCYTFAQKRERQTALFPAFRHVSFAAWTTSAKVVFCKSRSMALSAEANTLSNVFRMQFPTGQPAFGFRAGELNGSGSSTAR